MEIKSTKDLILIRNCILINNEKIKLESNPQNSTQTTSALQEFSTLVNAIKLGEFDQITQLLESPSTPDFTNFAQHIQTLSASELAEHYLDVAKQLLNKYGNEDKDKFNEFTTAFYKGNEHLLSGKSKNPFDLEEEPEDQPAQEYSQSLLNLKKLAKSLNSTEITPILFQQFCTQYSNNVLSFANEIFSRTFAKNGQNLTDLSIQYDSNDDLRKVYSATFSFSSPEDEIIHQENAAFSNTYFQTLCKAYLDSKEFADKSPTVLEAMPITQLKNKIISFGDYFINLENMARCDIDYAGDRFFYKISTFIRARAGLSVSA